MGRGGRSGVPEVMRRGGASAGILYGMMGGITGFLLVPLRCPCFLEAIYKLFHCHQLPMSMETASHLAETLICVAKGGTGTQEKS
jgi:hypothetical protein